MRAINFLRSLAKYLTLSLALVSIYACAPDIEEQSASPITQEVSAIPFSPDLTDWPHINSDIKPDSRVHFGRLSNGLRYAILPVPDKDGAVSINLNIEVGFNNEPSDAHGIAHLLEHMAFRGAQAEDKGSIIHDLEARGLEHGRDINGFTGPDHTFYMINLPSNDRKLFEAAMRNMSQLAIKPNLSEENLVLEKGVVIAELNFRNTLDARALLSFGVFENPQNPRKTVSGAGTEESINGIGLDTLKQFYDKHYRPDNALLTIAGDVEIDKVENLLKTYYADWEAKTKKNDVELEPEIFDLETLPKRFSFEEEGSFTRVVAIENLPSSQENDTVAFRQRTFAQEIAVSILWERLNERIADDDSVSWVDPLYERHPGYDLRGVRMGAKDYVKAMTYFEEERLRAIKYGFTQEEINHELERKRITREYWAKKHDKISAFDEAARLRNNFSSGLVYSSYVQELDLFNQFSDQLTDYDYNLSALSSWENFDPRFWSQSDKDFKIPMEALASIVKKGASQNIDQPTASKIPEFRTSPSIQKGQIKSRDTMSFGKVHRLLYENGTRLNYQRGKKNPDKIEISVAISGDPRAFSDRYNSVKFRAFAFSRADIKGITKFEIDRALTGKQASFFVDLIQDKIIISSSTQPSDLETALNVIATFIVDVDYASQHQQDEFERQKKRIEKALRASPLSAASIVQPYAYSGESPSFSPDHFTELPNTLSDLEEIFSEGAIEVGIVGDFNPDDLEEIFSNSIGGLPARKARPNSELLGQEALMPLGKGLTSLTYPGSDQQMALSYCWPLKVEGDDEMDVVQNINGEILQNRLIEKLRGDRGITYSPRYDEYSNPVFPNFKYNCFSVQIQPEDELGTHDDFREVLNNLKTNPVSKKELDRAREPKKSYLENIVNSNVIRAYILASAYSDPDKLSKNGKSRKALERLELKTVQQEIGVQFDMAKLHIFRTQHYQRRDALRQIDLKVKSHLGDTEALFEVGERLFFASKETDKALGLKTLKQASDGGSAKASLFLGRHYIFRDRNLEASAKYLERISETKDGAFELGHLYFDNFSTFPNVSDERIIALLTLSAEKGSARGQYMLAERLKDGTLVTRDEVGALKWALISNYTRRREASIVDEKGKERFVTGLTEDQIERGEAAAKAWIKRNPGEEKPAGP